MPKLRLAVFDDPDLVPMLGRLFPNAEIEIVPDYSVLPAIAEQIDGAIWTLEQASAWAAAHPGFTAVQPAGTGSPILLAYLMPPGADSLRQYLDQWLELKAIDGFRATPDGFLDRRQASRPPPAPLEAPRRAIRAKAPRSAAILSEVINPQLGGIGVPKRIPSGSNINPAHAAFGIAGTCSGADWDRGGDAVDVGRGQPYREERTILFEGGDALVPGIGITSRPCANTQARRAAPGAALLRRSPGSARRGRGCGRGCRPCSAAGGPGIAIGESPGRGRRRPASCGRAAHRRRTRCRDRGVSSGLLACSR